MDFNEEVFDAMFKNDEDCNNNDNDDSGDDAQFSDARIVLVTGNISDKTTQNVIKDLEKFALKDSETPIQMVINSRGGSAYDALSIIEYMRTLGPPIYTKTTGYAFSGAAAILSQGEIGYRVITKNAFVMFHELSSNMSGRMHDVARDFEQCEKLNNKIYDIVAHNCGLSTEEEIKEFQKKLSSDCYFNAEEAKDLGFIDKII